MRKIVLVISLLIPLNAYSEEYIFSCNSIDGLEIFVQDNPTNFKLYHEMQKDSWLYFKERQYPNIVYICPQPMNYCIMDIWNIKYNDENLLVIFQPYYEGIYPWTRWLLYWKRAGKFESYFDSAAGFNDEDRYEETCSEIPYPIFNTFMT